MWVFIPDSSVVGPWSQLRLEDASGLKQSVAFPAAQFDPGSGALIPFQDFYADPLSGALVELTQTTIANYGLTEPTAFLSGGSIIAGLNMQMIIDAFVLTSPWLLGAYISGWALALVPALLLQFVRR